MGRGFPGLDVGRRSHPNNSDRLYVSWAILFSPQTCRTFKANARRLAKPLIVAAIIIAALVIVSYIYRDAIGYHWYWGDCKFWEYRRYINPPNFPWWQWVLINL